ncbi:cytochrome P450 4C1 [Helicoverpa armigera]|uniref:cytochrome P450 4C1 n=1 Tax=Helicoverpa armigera TaxID=29058 RepID=UPI0030827654
MLSLILIYVLVVCLGFVILKRTRSSSEHALPPLLPGSLPIIGYTIQVVSAARNQFRLLKAVTSGSAEKGGITTTTFGTERYYFITDPQDAVTAANSCLQRHYAFDFCKPWLGDGLLTTSAETWKSHRKLLSPAFSLPVIHGLLQVFNSQSRKLLEEVAPHDGKGSFDHDVYLTKNALETLCVGTFGINIIDDEKFTQKYIKSLYEIIPMVTRKFVEVWSQSDFLYKLSGLKEKEDQLLDTLHSMTDKVLQEKKLARKGKEIKKEVTGIEYRPFLDLLLDLSENGDLSDQYIREETQTIIASGFETTSNQLTSTLVLLGAHPEVQEKMYEELIDVLQDRDVEKEDLNKLVYTNAVILESLRLFPTVPCLLRCVEKDVKLKNYTMRAGSYCSISPLVVNVNSPWKAETTHFDPEKWLNGEYKNNSEFAGFGLGKRGCIGKTYAMTMMKVVLSHFIRRYRVRADMSQVRVKFEFLLKPVSGHEIRIQRRN